MSVRIITDSASDLTQAEALKLGIDVLPLKVIFGDEEYMDGVTLDREAFYEKLVGGNCFPTTSQLAPAEYGAAFQAAADRGEEVVCITISSKLSGCFQSAAIAAEEFPGQITVVDSRNATVGEQLLVRLALRYADEGRSAAEIGQLLCAAREKIRLYALVDTLEYLKRGGRVSSAAAAVGTLLSIKPLVTVEDGSVVLAGKARGTKNGIQMLLELVENSGGIAPGMPASFVYTGTDDALLQQFLAAAAPLCTADLPPVCPIGSTIGSHVGPGAFGLAYFVK